jgi:hypothetical protein
MPGGGLAADRSPWITRVGVAVFVLLALGLVLLNGPGRALGYGSAPAPTCTGYHTVCKAQVESVRTTPRKPVARKGFIVAFNTTSGGAYTVSVKTSSGKVTTLAHGATGAGSPRLKNLGKHLSARRYTLTVKIVSNKTKAAASIPLTIEKA